MQPFEEDKEEIIELIGKITSVINPPGSVIVRLFELYEKHFNRKFKMSCGSCRAKVYKTYLNQVKLWQSQTV